MLQQFIKKQLWLNIIWRLLKEFTIYLQIQKGNFSYKTGQRNADRDLVNSINYIEKITAWYQQVVPINSGFLHNKKVLEVGPGDSFAMALRFLQLGASEVHCIDKFYCQRDEQFLQKLYQAIETKYNTNILQNGNIPTHLLRYEYGKGIEQQEHNNYYDFICSMAVLEHIYDIKKAIQSMDKMLKVGGTMAHRIDFRDHALFEYHHPLTFLTIPEWLYKKFSYYCNNPNRKLINDYQQIFDTLGNYQYKLFITRVRDRNLDIFKEDIVQGVDYDKQDSEFIDAIRPKLTKDFNMLPTKTLLITGIFLVAHKVSP